GAHFVVDTSRNGAGPTDDRQWCNPPGRALGSVPEVAPGVSPLVDAFLWVKTPGRSDGTCNGGPKAGDWWPEYLADLARRAGW
ncbi:MAG: glycoside hydrolase family 6 protein, partial [Acidimicrobiia bacterium]